MTIKLVTNLAHDHIQGDTLYRWVADGSATQYRILDFPFHSDVDVEAAVFEDGFIVRSVRLEDDVIYFPSPPQAQASIKLVHFYRTTPPTKSDWTADRPTVQAVSKLLEDGAKMREARHILDAHLHKVNANLLNTGHSWLLQTDLSTRAHQTFPTFAQALDAALTLLETRSQDNVKITSSADVAKAMGAE